MSWRVNVYGGIRDLWGELYTEGYNWRDKGTYGRKWMEGFNFVFMKISLVDVIFALTTKLPLDLKVYDLNKSFPI